MTLADYLKEAKKSQREFGGLLQPPVTQSLVAQWISGSTRITLNYALQIDDKTAGMVKPKDCDEMFTGAVSRAA